MTMFSKDNWTAKLLLSANALLESRYQQEASACLAMQIARNYRLLNKYDEHPLKQQLWQLRAKRWWLRYKLHCGDVAFFGVSEVL